MKYNPRRNQGFYRILDNEDWFICNDCGTLFEDKRWELCFSVVDTYEVICKVCKSKNVKKATATSGILG